MDESFSRFQHASKRPLKKPDAPNREVKNKFFLIQAAGLQKWPLRLTQLLLALFLFLIAIHLMSGSFRLMGTGFANILFAEITENPFIGLFIGLLATAVIQSSSMTITTVVLLVGAGDLSLEGAVPIIMGANIGTSITSTIVSLGHISYLRDYIRAISAAAAHSFFNIITVILLFSLERLTGFLSGIAKNVASFVAPFDGNFVDGLFFFVKDAADLMLRLLGQNPYLALPMGLLALFFSLQYLARLLKVLVIGHTAEKLNRYVFGTPLRSLLSGFVTTAAVQSSSMTISLIVPLVATAKVSLDRAFPFILGANIGTTTTAILAALFMSGSLAGAAMAVACAHLLFNVLGVLIIFPFPQVRQIPIRLAEGLGKIAGKNRLYGVAYVVILFFLIPFILVFLNKAL